MKKFLLLFSALVLFASCSKDDDSSTSGDIVGSWSLTSMETMGQNMSVDLLGISLSLNFTSDGKWTGSASGDGMPDFGSGTYSLSGSKLTMKELGYTYTWSVKKLTSSELTMSLSLDGVAMTWYFKKR